MTIGVTDLEAVKFAVIDDGLIWRLIVSALGWLGSNLLGLMSA